MIILATCLNFSFSSPQSRRIYIFSEFTSDMVDLLYCFILKESFQTKRYMTFEKINLFDYAYVSGSGEMSFTIHINWEINNDQSYQYFR